MAILDMNSMASVGAARQLSPNGAAQAPGDHLLDVPFLSRRELEAILRDPRPTSAIPAERASEAGAFGFSSRTSALLEAA